MTPVDEERELRKRLDSAIGQALVDHEYAAELLARPQEKLGTPEVDDNYTTLRELAQHTVRLFWPPWNSVGRHARHGYSQFSSEG